MQKTGRAAGAASAAWCCLPAACVLSTAAWRATRPLHSHAPLLLLPLHSAPGAPGAGFRAFPALQARLSSGSRPPQSAARRASSSGGRKRRAGIGPE